MTPYDWEANKHLLCDSTGKRLTIGLFEELADPSTAAKPVFKLEDWRKTYVEIADPSDYKAAMVLIGNWDHWQLLCNTKAFAEHLERWREEVAAKLRSEGVEQLRKQSRQPTGTAAARWLAENGFEPKRGKGRPPKQGEKQTDDYPRLAYDAKRIGLKG